MFVWSCIHVANLRTSLQLYIEFPSTSLSNLKFVERVEFFNSKCAFLCPFCRSLDCSAPLAPSPDYTPLHLSLRYQYATTILASQYRCQNSAPKQPLQSTSRLLENNPSPVIWPLLEGRTGTTWTKVLTYQNSMFHRAFFSIFQFNNR